MKERVVMSWSGGKDSAMALQELLRNDAAQRGRKHCAHVRLLVRRERVHEPVDGLRGAIRMQGAHDENAHLRRRDGDAHSFMIAQLADQDHVRILAQG